MHRLKNRLDKLVDQKDDDLVELPGGITKTWAEWRALFNRIKTTPDSRPLKFPPGTAERSEF